MFKFWIKTFLYYFLPIHLRYLYKYRDLNYIHEIDKHPVRFKHYGKGGWSQEEKQEFTYRDYTDYNEYITHQKQKFNEIIRIEGGFTFRLIAKYRLRFYDRFRYLPKFLSKNAEILCAGARQGTEVEVLRDIGYHKAYGIDLNPGPNNKYVQIGDFMHLKNADSSLDMVYSNCLDHAFDLDAFFKEHARVIKPNGFALYEISLGGGGAFETVQWKSISSVQNLMLKHFKKIIMTKIKNQWKWMLLFGKKNP
ncbi:MAG: methyltransferase domain-containing protein [Promethearchaeota archaeon]